MKAPYLLSLFFLLPTMLWSQDEDIAQITLEKPAGLGDLMIQPVDSGFFYSFYSLDFGPARNNPLGFGYLDNQLEEDTTLILRSPGMDSVYMNSYFLNISHDTLSSFECQFVEDGSTCRINKLSYDLKTGRSRLQRSRSFDIMDAPHPSFAYVVVRMIEKNDSQFWFVRNLPNNGDFKGRLNWWLVDRNDLEIQDSGVFDTYAWKQRTGRMLSHDSRFLLHDSFIVAYHDVGHMYTFNTYFENLRYIRASDSVNVSGTEWSGHAFSFRGELYNFDYVHVYSPEEDTSFFSKRLYRIHPEEKTDELVHRHKAEHGAISTHYLHKPLYTHGRGDNRFFYLSKESVGEFVDVPPFFVDIKFRPIIFAFDKNMNHLWTKSFKTEDDNVSYWPMNIAQLHDGSLVVASYKYNYVEQSQNEFGRLHFMKIDTNGQVLSTHVSETQAAYQPPLEVRTLGRDRYQLVSPLPGRVRWQLYDLHGQPVREGRFHHQTQLQTEALSSGMYVLRARRAGRALPPRKLLVR